MVVMAIMALMSTLGILAMVGINNNVLADQAAEGILDQLREVQNKSFSVSSDPDPAFANSYPLAWGMKVDKEQDKIETYFIRNNSNFSVLSTVFDKKINYQIKSINIVDQNSSTPVNTRVFFSYATPFGKFTLQNTDGGGVTYIDPCHRSSLVDLVCSQENKVNPKSIIFPSGIGKRVDFTISFRNVEKTVTVEANGEAYISG